MAKSSQALLIAALCFFGLLALPIAMMTLRLWEVYTATPACPVRDQSDYKVTVEGEHEDDICEVVLLDSPISKCAEKVRGRDRARIVLTHNNGVVSNTRYASPLGFLADTPLEVCPEVLKELNLLPTIEFLQLL
ncbi:pollen allergen Sal k 5.0101-like [Macadamia integrifolia]|uniref:pollen allergen Sal k 5.0101-like n=1 Tax=Macadamia integrifolia TaxID=60698 RepID=UPI001C52DDBD|nr:pollen allergen Sal k 5.0101-like [Macadamia integrifolia]